MAENFDKVECFAFEMILKNETKKYIQNFDESANRIKKDGVKMSSSIHGRDTTFKSHEWDLNGGLESCWDEIDENDISKHVAGIEPDSKRTKPHVKKFRLFLIEAPHLPYDFIVFNAIMDEVKITEVTDPNSLLNILIPMNEYVDRFPGIINSTILSGRNRPCYIKFHSKDGDSKKDLFEKELKILMENQNKTDDKNIKKYLSASQKLSLTHFKLDSLNHDLTTVTLKEGYFSLLGFLHPITSGISIHLSNFEIIFEKSKISNHVWGWNTHFLNDIDIHFSTHLLFVSAIIFLLYLIRKCDEFKIKLKELLADYQQEKTKKSFSHEEFYKKLADFNDNLLFMNNELDSISFFITESLSRTISSIRTFPLMTERKDKPRQYHREGFLKEIHELSKSQIPIIQTKLDELKQHTSQLKNKFHDDILLKNTLSMNKYSGRNFWLSVSMLAATTIITIKIIIDFF